MMALERDVPDAVPGLLKAGQVLAAEEFASRRKWSHQALSEALKAKRVFYLNLGASAITRPSISTGS